jgi:hypothetical protein
MGAAEKDALRELAQRGGPYTAEERQALLDYCESDVRCLERLLPRMLPDIDVPRALMRGRYMAAVARMEWTGTPIDTATLAEMRDHWRQIQGRLIEHVDRDYGVYDGRTFKRDRFAQWLACHGICWPHLESGELALDDNTFREMSRAFPGVAPLRELRHTLGELRLESLAVGVDGRNRCLLSPFRSKTGRNQPSNSKFIFGPSCWMRSLIQPSPGQAVAYVDYSQQEFGIVAALSEDPAMMDAYASGDPYLAFAKQAGAAPPDATKESHKQVRDQFKVCALAVQYGMAEQSLALKLGQPQAHARQLLGLHRQTYPRFWRWSENAVMYAMLHGRLYTTFGWQIRVGNEANPRSLANFPALAHGAEMLRLACSLATEAGITVCAPVHDAVLIESPSGQIEAAVARTRQAMAEASRIVLNGFEIRSDAVTVCGPDRYFDERGKRMWETVGQILKDISAETIRETVIGFTPGLDITARLT